MDIYAKTACGNFISKFSSSGACVPPLSESTSRAVCALSSAPARLFVRGPHFPELSEEDAKVTTSPKRVWKEISNDRFGVWVAIAHMLHTAAHLHGKNLKTLGCYT